MDFKDGFGTSYDLSMLGDVQAQNSVLAIMMLRNLGLYKRGETEKALENNHLPGRMETVKWNRTLILDGAHTQSSMEHLLGTFKNMYPKGKGVCIFGAVEGKNHEAMAEAILGTFDTVIVSRPGTFKKSNPQALYEMLKRHIDEDTASKASKASKKVYLECEAKDALELARKLTDSDEPILVCGSFYLAGAIKEELERQEKEQSPEPNGGVVCR